MVVPIFLQFVAVLLYRLLAVIQIPQEQKGEPGDVRHATLDFEGTPLIACAIVRRAGVKLPTVTVCFKNLNVSTTVYVGSRALPSTLNAYRNFIEVQAVLK